MERTSIVKLLALVILLFLVSGTSFFFGDKHAVETMSFTRVNADQVASAMKADHFYTDYRESSLVLTGTVASITHHDSDVTVAFQTSSSFKTLCDFGDNSPAFHQGDTITVLSEGGSAQRQQSAVLLTDCLLH